MWNQYAFSFSMYYFGHLNLSNEIFGSGLDSWSGAKTASESFVLDSKNPLAPLNKVDLEDVGGDEQLFLFSVKYLDVIRGWGFGSRRGCILFKGKGIDDGIVDDFDECSSSSDL